MNTKPPSSARVDEKVYIAMASLIVLSLAILAFRYAAHQPCASINLRISSGSFIQGSLINFNADTKDGHSFDWDFGDGTRAKSADPYAAHHYDVAGRYTVSVMVNGECAELQSVVIKNAPIIINNSLQPVILVADTAFINTPMTVEDISPSSTAWAWRFEEGDPVDAATRKASHTYTIAGAKQIYLEVNGRSDLQVSRWIMVVDPHATKTTAAATTPHVVQNRPVVISIPNQPSEKPLDQQQATTPTPKPVDAPKGLEVSPEQMATLLKGVNENGKTADDFSGYLCGKLTMPVVYDNNQETFSKMCDDLKAIKKGRIKSIKVILTKDQQNCIVQMNVTVDKKWKLF
jgi:PKD repeat protein